MLSLFAFLRVAFLIIGIWAITRAIGRRYPRRSIARPRLDKRLTRVLRALAYVALLFLLVMSVLLLRAFFGWPIWMQTMLDYPLAILIVALFVLAAAAGWLFVHEEHLQNSTQDVDKD